jgi:hypothetical protein
VQATISVTVAVRVSALVGAHAKYAEVTLYKENDDGSFQESCEEDGGT